MAQPKTGAASDRGVLDTDRSELILSVPSIHCQGCVETIEANLRLAPGIESIAGDVKTKRVRVAYRSRETSPEEIESAVTRLGHRVDRSDGRSVRSEERRVGNGGVSTCRYRRWP